VDEKYEKAYTLKSLIYKYVEALKALKKINPKNEQNILVLAQVYF
jgi:hypothetical protein